MPARRGNHHGEPLTSHLTREVPRTMTLTKEALRELADGLEPKPLRSSAADDAVRVAAVAQLREWADDMEHAENGEEACEGCGTWLAEDEGHSDVEGVRLCSGCWDGLLSDVLAGRS